MINNIIFTEIKNKWRLLFKTIKIYWVSLVCILAVMLFSLHYVITTILKITIGTPIDSNYIIYLLLAIICYFLYRIFFCKQPTVKMFSATLQYSYNSKFFTTFLRLKYFTKIVLVLFGCFLLSFIASGFIFEHEFFILFTRVGGLSTIGYALSWVVFHNNKSKLLSFFIFILCSLLVILPYEILILPLLLMAVIINWYAGVHLSKFSIVKYRDTLIKADKVESAAARNDYAEMLQMAEENRSQEIVGFNISSIRMSRNTAFIYKSIIELLRTQKSNLVISVIFLVLGIAVGRFDILDLIIPINLDEASLFVTAYLLSTALITINNQVANHYNNILTKHRLGLFVPISFNLVMTQYLTTLVIVNTAFVFIIGMIFKKSLLVIMLVLFITCLLSALILFSQKLSSTKKKIISGISSIGFFLIIMLLLLTKF